MSTGTFPGVDPSTSHKYIIIGRTKCARPKKFEEQILFTLINQKYNFLIHNMIDYIFLLTTMNFHNQV